MKIRVIRLSDRRDGQSHDAAVEAGGDPEIPYGSPEVPWTTSPC